MKQDKANKIDQEAAEWAAKVDRALSSDEQSDLDLWLSGDIRHIGALGRMRALALQTERVAASGPLHSSYNASPEEETTQPSRRRFLLSGGAMAASLAGMATAGWWWMKPEHILTHKGEMRQIALQDGSVVTLNTASEMKVRMTEKGRHIELISGEALFDVAPDKTRPFIVSSGDTAAMAVGTSFIVQALPGEPVKVLVREGIVEVSRKRDEGKRPYRLKANMSAVSLPAETDAISDAVLVNNISPISIDRALAWRDGQIDFQGETLQEAAREFARYSDTRILVAPGLAGEQIAGLYQTSDPIGFAKAVAESLRARTEISSGEIHITK